MTAPVTVGRPLDLELSDTILDAAIDVLAREGYAGFSIAAVAQQARVHRPAIYRRWPSKVDLAVATIERLKPTPPDRDSGDARADILAYLVTAGCNQKDEANQIAMRLASELAADAEFDKAVQERIVQPRRQLLRSIVERGIERGQLRADLDPDLAIDVLTGFLHARKAHTTKLRPAEVEKFVDLVLGGMSG